MDNKTVFVRTDKGEAEARGETSLLFGEAKRVFMLVNNKSTVDDLRKHAAPSLRPDLDGILEQLESDDFIRDKYDKGPKKGAPSAVMAKLATPPKMATPAKPAAPEPATEEEDALDFTSGLHPPVRDTGEPPPTAQPAAPSAGELDFSSLVPPAAPGAAKPAPAAPSAPPPKSGPAEIDFSSLLSPAAPGAAKPAPAPQPAPEAKKPAEIDFSSILSGGGVDKAKQAAEEKARADAAAQARAMEEAKARMRAELEAKVRAENEAKARAAAEGRMRAEAEAKARAEARAREEAEARARAEAETKAKLRAEFEAKMRAEAEARARAEAEAKARAEAEARAQAERETRARAEMEARARAEAEAKMRAQMEARARAEAETKMRAEAEAKAQAEREKQATSFAELDFSSILQTPAVEPAPDMERIETEARLRAEAETKARAEAEARAKAEAEARTRAEADARAKLRAELEAGIRNVQVADARMTSGRNQARSMIATVLFFDIVGYTKQSVARQIELKAQFNSLISGLIGHVDEEHRIILDTGDGAAIGFLQHPEDALDVAMKFRAAVTANNHRNYPDLKVRAGIHLGPVNVMKDMNDQLNMVGDGINDAQRIMSFAGVDQIYVSRAYFDVISRLTADSARLFKYYGTQKDKHGREHQVYQVLGDGTGVSKQGVAPPSGGVESLLQDLSMMLQEPEAAPAPSPQPPRPAPQSSGEWQPMEIPGAQPSAPRAPDAEAQRAAEQARVRAQQEAARARAEEEAARAREQEEATMRQQEEAAAKLAADQAKAFAEAEKRARKIAEQEEKARQREAKVREKEAKKQAKREAAAASKAARRPARRPARGGHGFPLFKALFALLVLAVGAVVGLPNIWPMQNYIPLVERELSSQLQQPVHISGMSVATVPAPRLDLRGVTIGSAQQLKIGHVAAFFDPLTLPANVKRLNEVELEDVSVDADSFSSTLPWLLAAGASDKYPLSQMELHGVHVTGNAPIPAFGGKIKFDAYGRYAKATFSSADGKYQVELEPKDKGRAQIDVSVSDGSLPMVSGINFATLELVGELADGVANFTDVSGALYGGSLKGTATLSWQNGWQVQGNVAVRSVMMDKAMPKLRVSGEMEGNASFLMNGTVLAQLVRAPRLQGTFSVKDGQVDGLDLAETLRSDTRQVVAGSTHFDVMTGALRVDSAGTHLKPVKISAGAMSISGSVDASTDGALAGQFLVDTSKVRVGLGTLPLHLGGAVSAPAWSTGR